MTDLYPDARRELRLAREIACQSADTIAAEARKAHRGLEPAEAAVFKSLTRAAAEADAALRALGVEPDDA